jgi:hypothetical protein
MADDFKGLNKETLSTAIGISNSMKEIGIATQSIEAKLKKSSGYLTNIKDSYDNIKRSANRVVDLQKEAAKSSKATTDAIKEQNKQLSIVDTLNIQIDKLYAASTNSTGKTRDNLLKQAQNISAARDNASKLADVFEDIANDSSKLDKSTKFFGNLSKIVSDIPVLRKFSAPFEKAAEAARQQVLSNAKTGKNTSALLTGAKSLGSSLSSFLKGPIWITALLAVGKFFVDAMFAADKRITNIAKNLSLSKEESAGIYKNLTFLKGTLDTSLGSTQNIVDAFNELSRLTEFNSIAQQNQIDAQIILTKEIGVSTEAALGFQETLAVSNIEGNKGLDIVYDQIAAYANQNKVVANGAILFEKISKTSKLIQINFKGNLGLLAKTTLEASKLGLSLDQVNKIGESLLDFESSISSELEAELLTGKQLNLEKAREFALNHDIAGLTQEIAKNGITAEKFASMNVIQQEAIAKTLGMNANELADSLYKQQVLNKTGGVYLKQLKERAESLRNEGKENEAIKLEKEAALVEQGILEGKNLKEAQKSADAQEKFNVAVERIKEVFSDLVNGGMLDKLVDYLDQFVGSLETGSSVLGTMVFGPDSKSEIASSRKSSLEEQLKTAKDDDEKKKLQEKIKKQEEIYNAEKAKENKEALKTVGISQSEIKQIQNNEVVTAPRGPKFAEGGIITKPVSNATIGEAGPEAIIPLGELMKHFNAMNNTLNAILQKDSNVYLDGTKVGTAMNVGTYRVQ